MENIVVACESCESARRGASVAANLSVASGARISLVYVEPTPAPPGLEAMTYLSDVLFVRRDLYAAAPMFRTSEPDWMEDLRETVSRFVVLTGTDTLVSRIEELRPDLVITAEWRLTRLLVKKSRVPVWQVRESHVTSSWLSLRKLRCMARGQQSADWARLLAASLGAELEIADSGSGDAHVEVVARGTTGVAMRLWAARPVIVV